MSITICKAAPEDARELLEHLKIIGGETDNLTFGGEGLPLTEEEEEDRLRKRMESDCCVTLLAKKDGRIVGNANFDGFTRERLKHRGELAISVSRSEWGQGIGRMLMEGIIEFARNTAHAEIVSLEVRSDNERAICLYEKFGFEKIGCFKGFLKIGGQFVDCDLMNLYLARKDG